MQDIFFLSFSEGAIIIIFMFGILLLKCLKDKCIARSCLTSLKIQTFVTQFCKHIISLFASGLAAQ